MSKKKHYDIVIVGGGLVGAALAIALKNTKYTVAVLESNQPVVTENSTTPSLNQRAIVLSKASQNILSTLDLWSEIAQHATPVEHIHVSNKGHFGAVRIDAKNHNVDALGYVVVAEKLYQQLQASLTEVDVFYGAKFKDVKQVGKQAEVFFDCDGEQTIVTDLVVAADGSHSAVRASQNIQTTEHDYQQQVILCNIALQRDHHNVAYERFTNVGPCALLPMSENASALIWATTPNEANEITALSKAQFLKRLQNHFGYRLGKFVDMSQPFSFPLSLVKASALVQPNVVLIGNAAQTLHPIAGQGLNLGLRDMATLAQLLVASEKPIGSSDFLNDYVAWRQFDRTQTVGLTHSLVTLFSTDFMPVNLATTTGMVLFERLPMLRNQFANATMGLMGSVPKLACGIKL